MTGQEVSLPTGVILQFAVEQGWKSTGGVSKAHLRGELKTYAQTITGPARYQQHFLCADVPEINVTKLEAFYSGVQNGANDKTCWIACVRGPSEIALSAIIQRIENIGLSKPYEIVWTCCRSPINELARGTVYYEASKLIPKQNSSTDSTATSLPSLPAHRVYNDCSAGLLTVFSSSDIHSVGTWGAVSILGIDKGKYTQAKIFGDPRINDWGDRSLGI
jgi:hypothetical protein